MKRNISKILAIFLTIAMLSSLVVASIGTASAGKSDFTVTPSSESGYPGDTVRVFFKLTGNDFVGGIKQVWFGAGFDSNVLEAVASGSLQSPAGDFQASNLYGYDAEWNPVLIFPQVNPHNMDFQTFTAPYNAANGYTGNNVNIGYIDFLIKTGAPVGPTAITVASTGEYAITRETYVGKIIGGSSTVTVLGDPAPVEIAETSGGKLEITCNEAGEEFQFWALKKESTGSNIDPLKSDATWVLVSSYSSSNTATTTDAFADFVIDGQVEVAVGVKDAYDDVVFYNLASDVAEPFGITDITVGGQSVFTTGKLNVGSTTTDLTVDVAVTETADSVVISGNGVSGNDITPNVGTNKYTVVATKGTTTVTKTFTVVKGFAASSIITDTNVASLGGGVFSYASAANTGTLNVKTPYGSSYNPTTKELTFKPGFYGMYDVLAFVGADGNYDDAQIDYIDNSRGAWWIKEIVKASNTYTAKVIPAEHGPSCSGKGGCDGSTLYYQWLREDAKGYTVVKDWSTDDSITFVPVMDGSYDLIVHVKYACAGSYEARSSVTVVKSTAGSITAGTANIVTGTLTAGQPVVIEATANQEGALYRFEVYDAQLKRQTVQDYSISNTATWIPRKAAATGFYTIRVMMRTDATFGVYEHMETIVVPTVG